MASETNLGLLPPHNQNQLPMDHIGRISSVDGFKEVTTHIIKKHGYREPAAFAIGLARHANDGTILDVYFPHANLSGEASGTAALFQEVTGWDTYTDEALPVTVHGYVDVDTINKLLYAYRVFASDGKKHPNIEALKIVKRMMDEHPVYGSRHAIMVFIHKLDEPPINTQDAYLRLHLLSMLKAKPNSINTNEIFKRLQTCSWTRQLGPVKKEEFEAVNASFLMTTGNRLSVDSEDKFPRMTDYVQPAEDVRIANADNVRLGAHLSPGTVIMHAGAVNFNAGTLGKCMIEGRISAGVVVGDGSDIGGGASIMGTLSGGGKEKITIGEKCLIGANGGTGISLGDHCKIEAGLYLKADTRVQKPDGSVVKAIALSGGTGMTFYRDQDGTVKVVASKSLVELNPMLHKH